MSCTENTSGALMLAERMGLSCHASKHTCVVVLMCLLFLFRLFSPNETVSHIRLQDVWFVHEDVILILLTPVTRLTTLKDSTVLRTLRYFG